MKRKKFLQVQEIEQQGLTYRRAEDERRVVRQGEHYNRLNLLLFFFVLSSSVLYDEKYTLYC